MDTKAATTDLNKIIRVDYGSDRLYQDLGLESIKAWQEWSKDCETRLGRPLFHQTGVAYLSRSQDFTKEDCFEKDSVETLRSAGLEGSVLEGNVYEKFPGLSAFAPDFPSGYVNTLGGWGNSGLSIEYLYQVLQEKGVKFILGREGSFQEVIVDNGVAIGVITADGKRHLADKIVLATGSWSPDVITELRPWLTSLGQPVVHIRVPESLVERYSSPNFPVWTGDIRETGFYGFPISPDTGLLKMAHHGPGFVTKSGGPRPSETTKLPPEAVTLFTDFISKSFPDLAQIGITSSRMCWYTDSLDGDFYICRSPSMVNLVYATGGSGHGFKFMPRIGGIVLDVIQGRETPFTRRFAWREPKNTGPGKDGCRQQGADGPQTL